MGEKERRRWNGLVSEGVIGVDEEDTGPGGGGHGRVREGESGLSSEAGCGD